MSEETKTAVDKLKIISEITQSNELQQTIKVLIQFVKSLDEKKELGFGHRGGKS